MFSQDSLEPLGDFLYAFTLQAIVFHMVLSKRRYPQKRNKRGIFIFRDSL
jgi:hypothetical protein